LTLTQPSKKVYAANAVDVALGSTGCPKTLVRARKRDVDNNITYNLAVTVGDANEQYD
jgi:hypothetical protein